MLDYFSQTMGSALDLWRRFKVGVGYQLVQPDSTTNPMTRDTLLAEKYQFAIVAFVADNPGVLELHCDNDFQARSVMFKQIVEMRDLLVDRVGTWAKVVCNKFNYTGTVNAIGGEAAVESWKRNLIQAAANGAVFES